MFAVVFRIVEQLVAQVAGDLRRVVPRHVTLQVGLALERGAALQARVVLRLVVKSGLVLHQRVVAVK